MDDGAVRADNTVNDNLSKKTLLGPRKTQIKINYRQISLLGIYNTQLINIPLIGFLLDLLQYNSLLLHNMYCMTVVFCVYGVRMSFVDCRFSLATKRLAFGRHMTLTVTRF